MSKTNDLVVHPNHYNRKDRKECWDEMIEKFDTTSVVIFDCLSAYKYKYRAGEKDGNPEEQDLAKIKNYLDHASKLLALYPNAKARKIYKTMLEELENDTNI